MIYLSLDSINKQDVYYVMLSPRGGYIFETGNGIHYTISFEEENSFGGCDTYQFVIKKGSGNALPMTLRLSKRFWLS